MPYSSNNSSDLRTVLTQIKEIRESMKNFDSVKDSTKMVEDNITLLGDELFNRLKEMEERVNKKLEDVVQPVLQRLEALEGKIAEISQDVGNGEANTPPSAKRRKIQRNPDLSVGF